MKDFEYLPAKTVEEACSLISRHREEGKILAEVNLITFWQKLTSFLSN
jgi:CO/xanthine dehydrogenase FAD-binding subunit